EIVDLIEFLEEEGVFIENPNHFKSLSDWQVYWSSYLENRYASRGGFINDLYAKVFHQIDLVLCQYYVKDKSQQELVDEWQISRFEDLKAKIKELKLTMLSVATQGQPVELVKSEDEDYKKLYREIALQISILREIGIAAANPNQFRSLWQWYNYWSFKLDKSYTVRREYIDNLYKSVLEPIEKALNKHCIKETSLEEFLQDLKRRFKPPATSISPTTNSPILTPALSNSLQTSTLKVEESLEQQVLEQIPNSFSVAPPQVVETSFFINTNVTFNWVDENLMNPEIFLEQEDVVNLENCLENLFAIKVDNATSRRSIFTTSGVKDSFMRNINFYNNPVEITNIVVAKFKDYKVSNQQVDYHPMVYLLKYLLKRQKSYELEDQDVELFTRLVEKGEENLKALVARTTVGRIESPVGKPIGTGVLIANNLLLTCHHIFTKTQVQKAWVRFGYKAGSYESAKDVFEIDMNFVSYRSQPDYALVKLKEKSQQQKAIPSDAMLDSGQEIRVIHHPLGNPVVISDLGQIIQVGEDYIDHNVKTDDGSSGAPIFNRQWELIAIHQGNVGIGRNFELGTTGGIPIRAIWNQISSYLA
ncbi:MAG: trypsin-like peptidase domain-containing protein, partial [Brasilonema sp.]